MSFPTAKDMVLGIQKFKALIETGNAQTKGCLIEIARIKNMLADTKNWVNLSDFHYVK